MPKLAPFLSTNIPLPVAIANPSKDFPYHWSINTWIEGSTAACNNIANISNFAKELGLFLKELHAIDTQNGPLAGKHNFYRGGDLSIYHQETLSALNKLKYIFPVEKLQKLWDAALCTKWEKAPFWIHGDIAVGNILVQNGKLKAIIDFGLIGVGDPACDYVMS